MVPFWSSALETFQIHPVEDPRLLILSSPLTPVVGCHPHQYSFLSIPTFFHLPNVSHASDTSAVLVHALVTSCLGHCRSLLFGLPARPSSISCIFTRTPSTNLIISASYLPLILQTFNFSSLHQQEELLSILCSSFMSKHPATISDPPCPPNLPSKLLAGPP